MNIEASVAEQQLITQFLEALRALPDVRAKLDPQPPETGAGRSFDAQIDLNVSGKSFMLQIEAKKKAVYPRDVSHLLWRLLADKYSGAKPDEAPLSLLVAESISPGAKELLREQRVGYYDSGGSLYLPAPGAYLYIDKPPPKTLAKSIRALYSGRRAQVLHALLVRHDDWFGVNDLAQLAMVSPATASQVLSELELFDWAVSRGQGPSKQRHLSEPGALLDAWAQQLALARPLSLQRYYVPGIAGTNADNLLARVSKAFDASDAAYAISHEAAAQRYAPFLSSVSQVRARLMMDARAKLAIAELDARVVSEGANLAIIEARSPGELLFRELIGDVWLASPVQVYLDLLRGEGRAKEMAEHLRKERLGF